MAGSHVQLPTESFRAQLNVTMTVAWCRCFVGRPMVSGDGSFVLGDRGDENFGGSCAEIPKLSTGRSLNSCVDCKISISVTSKALENFRAI